MWNYLTDVIAIAVFVAFVALIMGPCDDLHPDPSETRNPHRYERRHTHELP